MKTTTFIKQDEAAFGVAQIAANDPLEDMFLADRSRLFCIFDGHGGAECSRFLLQYFNKRARSEIVGAQNPKEALLHAFINADEAFMHESVKLRCEKLEREHAKHGSGDIVSEMAEVISGALSVGSCAMAAYVTDNTVYVSNCGDSRAILGRMDPQSGKFAPVVLSSDHNTTNEAERKLVIERSGDPNALRRAPSAGSAGKRSAAEEREVRDVDDDEMEDEGEGGAAENEEEEGDEDEEGEEYEEEEKDKPMADVDQSEENGGDHHGKASLKELKGSEAQNGGAEEVHHHPLAHPPPRPAKRRRAPLLRVAGSLMVTRAMGDAYLKGGIEKLLPPPFCDVLSSKNYITCVPEVTVTPFKADSEDFLVIASDGLYEELQNEEVVAIVAKCLGQGLSPAQAANKLVRTVLDKVCKQIDIEVPFLQQVPAGPARRLIHDDTTVIVVLLGKLIAETSPSPSSSSSCCCQCVPYLIHIRGVLSTWLLLQPLPHIFHSSHLLYVFCPALPPTATTTTSCSSPSGLLSTRV
mmetsp:Transcript_23242/g.38951  ORF Transcript_23242/g.38951 Transcript_23242/m.38951 type:complete len:524 (-) Transcript_23242:637-2208(-)